MDKLVYASGLDESCLALPRSSCFVVIRLQSPMGLWMKSEGLSS